MDRKSSDELASQASGLLNSPNPLDDDAKLDAMIVNVIDADRTLSREAARKVIRDEFAGYFEAARSFAASVVSQADGPE